MQESGRSGFEGSEPSGRNLDPFAAEVAEALRSNPAMPYDIGARWCGEGRYRIVVAARTEAGEIQATSFEARCAADAVRAAFQRIGGSGHAAFEQRVDQLALLLGRAEAVAHATTEELIAVAAALVGS